MAAGPHLACYVRACRPLARRALRVNFSARRTETLAHMYMSNLPPLRRARIPGENAVNHDRICGIVSVAFADHELYAARSDSRASATHDASALL